MVIQKSIFFLFTFFLTIIPMYAFDPLYYIKEHQLPFQHSDLDSALNHFTTIGIHQKLSTAAMRIDNTNFDWEYYIQHNNISDIDLFDKEAEQKAYDHYITIGKEAHLPYCKPFHIMILLHVYDLDIMNELIENINYFIANNPYNTYSIKINIPVGPHLTMATDLLAEYNPPEETNLLTFIQNKVTSLRSNTNDLFQDPTYVPLLHKLYTYLFHSFAIPKENIDIIFSENRGMDIGGFLVLLHELKKEHTPFDFLIKLHTKKGSSRYGSHVGAMWRSCLLSFLNIKINKLLRAHDALYPCLMSSLHDPERHTKAFIRKKKYLCSELDIPLNQEYTFSAGTIFIVPYSFVTQIYTWNLHYVYSLLNPGRSKVGYEHVLERLFGYVGGQVSSSIACLDYTSRDYPFKYDI